MERVRGKSTKWTIILNFTARTTSDLHTIIFGNVGVQQAQWPCLLNYIPRILHSAVIFRCFRYDFISCEFLCKFLNLLLLSTQFWNNVTTIYKVTLQQHYKKGAFHAYAKVLKIPRRLFLTPFIIWRTGGCLTLAHVTDHALYWYSACFLWKGWREKLNMHPVFKLLLLIINKFFWIVKIKFTEHKAIY